MSGRNYILALNAIGSAPEPLVANPRPVAGAVAYSVQTPGTQSLFTKLVTGDSFPAAVYGPTTEIHEAGLFYNDGALFNRVSFYPTDDTVALVAIPTDAGGGSVDLQFNWLITF